MGRLVPQSIPHRFFATQRQSFFADPTDRRAQPYGSFARAHYTFERRSIWSGKTLLQSQRRSGAAAAETELPPQQFRRQRCFACGRGFHMLPLPPYAMSAEGPLERYGTQRLASDASGKGATPHAPFLTSRLAEWL